MLFRIILRVAGLKYHVAKLSAISIALRVILVPNSTGYSYFHSLIVRPVSFAL